MDDYSRQLIDDVITVAAKRHPIQSRKTIDRLRNGSPELIARIYDGTIEPIIQAHGRRPGRYSLAYTMMVQDIIGALNSSKLMMESAKQDQMLDLFREFLLFCKGKLKLDKFPKIEWFRSDVGEAHHSFGSFHNEDQVIRIGINHRHPLDIFRTLAHELAHYKQWTENKLGDRSGETGSPIENEANAVAGIIMRDWGQKHPEMFAQKPIDSFLTEGTTVESKFKWMIHNLRNNEINTDMMSDLTYLILESKLGRLNYGELDILAEPEYREPLVKSVENRKSDIIKYLLGLLKRLTLEDADYLISPAIRALKMLGIDWKELDVIKRSLDRDLESREDLRENTLAHIDQHDEEGGDLEGYVVDTDQPQLAVYLGNQGADSNLISNLIKKYDRIGIIRNMWVDEEARGRGIGSSLVEAAINEAFSEGAEAIILVADLSEDNAALGKPLDKWYEGWGFRTIGMAGSDPIMLLDQRL